MKGEESYYAVVPIEEAGSCLLAVSHGDLSHNGHKLISLLDMRHLLGADGITARHIRHIDRLDCASTVFAISWLHALPCRAHILLYTCNSRAL